MQWILQDFEDTRKLAVAVEAAGLSYSWHKVVPFIGELEPAPEIADPSDVILFGSYTLRHYAERHELSPGVFTIRPFVEEPAWQSALLNGPGATFVTLKQIPQMLSADDSLWFMRPVDDSKAEPGRVWTAQGLHDLAAKVMRLSPDEIPTGSLSHDTELMLCPPANIQQEWRVWVVGARVVTWSLYKEGRHVVYRAEIDDDALAFAESLVAANPEYAPAYVLDICRVDGDLRLLETNCLNAAGFYEADLGKLVEALEAASQAGLFRDTASA